MCKICSGLYSEKDHLMLDFQSIPAKTVKTFSLLPIALFKIYFQGISWLFFLLISNVWIGIYYNLLSKKNTINVFPKNPLLILISIFSYFLAVQVVMLDYTI